MSGWREIMIDHNRLNIFCEKLMKEYLTAEEHTEVKAELNKLIIIREKISKAMASAPKDDLQRKTSLKLLSSLKGKIQNLQDKLQADAKLRTCMDVGGSSSQAATHHSTNPS
jgi:hypothetical protein